MRYMIYDDEGNALGTFRSRIAAEATLRRIAFADPDGADDLVLMAYRDDGTLSGQATTIKDLPPTVRIQPTWMVLSAGWPSQTTRRPLVNRYTPLVTAGRTDPHPLVVRPTPHDLVPVGSGGTGE